MKNLKSIIALSIISFSLVGCKQEIETQNTIQKTASEPNKVQLTQNYKPQNPEYSMEFQKVKFKTESKTCKQEVFDFSRNLAQSIEDVEKILHQRYKKESAKITIQMSEEKNNDVNYELTEYKSNDENPFKITFVEKEIQSNENKTPTMLVSVNMNHKALENLQKCK